MSEDVGTAEVIARVRRVLGQLQAWQAWQRSLDRDPNDLQEFRQAIVAAGEDDPGDSHSVREIAERVRTLSEMFSSQKPAPRVFTGDSTMPVSPSLKVPDAPTLTRLPAQIPKWAARPASPPAQALASPPPQAPPRPAPLSFDPLAAARARGQQAKRDILATQGELLDAEQVASRLGIDLAEVEAQRQLGLLLALPLEHGGIGFPAWQFTREGLMTGLEDVFRDLGVRSPWMRAAFFFSGDLRLAGRTPLETLLGGEIEAVRGAGAAYGEQLAS